MMQLTGALHTRALTWYMTYTKKTPNATKAETKQQFLSFFKTPDPKHMAAKKVKMTVQNPIETFQDYEKILKYLVSQINLNIDEQILIQWFLTGLSQKIQRHIGLDTFKTYEEALMKALQVDMDEYYPTHPVCIIVLKNSWK